MPVTLVTRRIAPRALTALVAALLLPLLAGSAAGATLELTGPAGASVVVNGQTLGFLPLDGPLDLSPGRYVIESELSGFKSFERSVVLDSRAASLLVHIRFQRLSRGTAWRSNVLFAGLGQHYVGHRTRGWIFNAVEAGGLLVALGAELQRSNHRSDYLRITQEYDTTLNGDELVRLRGEADDTFQQMEDAEALRNNALLVAAGAIVVSIAEVLINFPPVAAGPGPVSPVTSRLDAGPAPAAAAPTSVHVGVRLQF